MVDSRVEQSASPEGSERPDSCGTCQDDSCSAKARQAGEAEAEFEERQRLQRRLCAIRHKVLVMSGKGGVGKSTVAVNLAEALHHHGRRVGLMDVDIHGPTVPTMLHIDGTLAESAGSTLRPVDVGGLKVMSIGCLIYDPNDAIIWRGPRKAGLIKSFLRDVEWGDLDYLVIDAPPGTGDEPLSVCQLVEGAAGAVIVTTPQEVALSAVRKSINFCRKLSLPILGVVENMSGFVCPSCGEVTDIFQAGGGAQMAREMGVPFLGRIPLDPKIGISGDTGLPFARNHGDSPVSEAFDRIVAPILGLDPPADGRGDD